MRIIEQAQADTIALTDQLVIDGEMVGTRAITFAKVLEDINKQIGWKALYGETIPVEVRRNIFRGKNLGSQVTDEQYAAIADGSFRDLYIGDYWEINSNRWRIVDINYWIGTGDQQCTTPHLVIMPDISLMQAKMNDTNTTQGGYVSSKMRVENLEQPKSTIKNIFGEAHVLRHPDNFVNAVADGVPTGGGWYHSEVDLPNEIMMYGCYVHAPAGNGVVTPYRYTIDRTQLALMQLYPLFVSPNRQGNWLRDVVSGTHFAFANGDGNATHYNASASIGVRPVFGVIG